MRQRKIKDIASKIAALEHLIISSDEGAPGKWRAFFGTDEGGLGVERKLYLEIGCGRGGFITESARRDPEGLYIGAEGLPSVIIRALEAVERLELTNVRFIDLYINDIEAMFAEGELDGIFLNFSDPWPKARHAKRRLTHIERLRKYAAVLKPGAILEFKTDNDELFEYSLEEMKACEGFDIKFVTRDLHASEVHDASPETEYERKFAAMGKSINYVALVRK